MFFSPIGMDEPLGAPPSSPDPVAPAAADVDSDRALSPSILGAIWYV
jgi:hypothetical protein